MRRSWDVVQATCAILAILISLATAGLSWWQISELRNQFEQSGPIVTVATKLQTEYKDPKKPNPPARDDTEQPVADLNTFETFDMVWLRVELVNNGRSETSIRMVRLEISRDNWVDATHESPRTWCTVPKDEPADCRTILPYLLQPGGSLTLFFALHDCRSTFARTNFGGNGLPLQIRATGVADQPLTYTSPIRVKV
jgi:hypothetical protein